MSHWSDRFDLYEALLVGHLAGYEPGCDVRSKGEYIVGLCCHMITNPCSSIATCHDYLVAARGACGRQVKAEVGYA